MKKIVVVALIAFILTFSVTACSPQPSYSSSTNELIGVWVRTVTDNDGYSSSYHYTFFENGTYSYGEIYDGEEYDADGIGMYSIYEDVILLCRQGSDWGYQYTYSISENTLTIDGRQYVKEK